MLTSYSVKCPSLECDFEGSLLPSRNTDSWKSSIPTTNIAVFECPRCHREWRAAIRGDDVSPEPLDDLAVAQLG